MKDCMTLLDPGIALVLLAAGRSERFGGDKLMAEYKGKPLWTWAAMAAEEAGFQDLYIVNSPRTSIDPGNRWQTVVNADADRGMGTSIAAGVAAAKARQRVVITLGDMPMVAPSHLRALAERTGPVFTRQPDGNAGCPAAFGRESFDQLRQLDGDRGARILAHPDAVMMEPTSTGMLVDIDYKSDLAAEGSR